MRWIADRPIGLTPDPWLRSIEVNIGARRADNIVWILSAGPNGIVETSFGGGPVIGDDVARACDERSRASFKNNEGEQAVDSRRVR